MNECKIKQRLISVFGNVAEIAAERMEELALEVERGMPVFFDSTFVDENEAKVLAELQARFKLVQRVPYLYELRLP